MNQKKDVVPRPTSAPPDIPAAVRVSVASNPRLHRWEVLFRMVIILVLLASLGLAWWSFTQVFLPVQKQSRDLGGKLSALASELDRLERKWDPAEADQIRRNYRAVYGQLFADQSALEVWLTGLEAKAAPLGLHTKIDFGKSRPATTNEHKLAIVPADVSLDVRPVPGGAESPYQRLLRLTHQLAGEGKRADLSEMTVIGGPDSIPRATLVFSLWAGEEGKP